MKKLTNIFKVVLILLLFTRCNGQEEKQVKVVSSDIPSAGGVSVKADIYEGESSDKPVILLFHQAGYSRGEYVETAPKLAEMGYTCIAIDQRSGKEVNGVVNETAKKAKAKGLATHYPDAFVDLEATLKFAKEKYPNKKFIAWGSSYSSSLVFILAQKHPKDIVATLSFSPGEYFEFEGKKVADFAKEIECPAFITSAKSEGDKWKSIFEAVPSEKKQSFLPSVSGQHGSKALWKKNAGYGQYWKAVNNFLETL